MLVRIQTQATLHPFQKITACSQSSCLDKQEQSVMFTWLICKHHTYPPVRLTLQTFLCHGGCCSVLIRKLLGFQVLRGTVIYNLNLCTKQKCIEFAWDHFFMSDINQVHIWILQKKVWVTHLYVKNVLFFISVWGTKCRLNVVLNFNKNWTSTINKLPYTYLVDVSRPPFEGFAQLRKDSETRLTGCYTALMGTSDSGNKHRETSSQDLWTFLTVSVIIGFSTSLWLSLAFSFSHTFKENPL